MSADLINSEFIVKRVEWGFRSAFIFVEISCFFYEREIRMDELWLRSKITFWCREFVFDPFFYISFCYLTFIAIFVHFIFSYFFILFLWFGWWLDSIGWYFFDISPFQNILETNNKYHLKTSFLRFQFFFAFQNYTWPLTFAQAFVTSFYPRLHLRSNPLSRLHRTYTIVIKPVLFNFVHVVKCAK